MFCICSFSYMWHVNQCIKYLVIVGIVSDEFLSVFNSEI